MWSCACYMCQTPGFTCKYTWAKTKTNRPAASPWYREPPLEAEALTKASTARNVTHTL